MTEEEASQRVDLLRGLLRDAERARAGMPFMSIDNYPMAWCDNCGHNSISTARPIEGPTCRECLREQAHLKALRRQDAARPFKYAGFSGPHPSLAVACPSCGSPAGHYCNRLGSPADAPHEERRALIAAG